MEDHPYCYPGTEVLRNKLDIRDGQQLEMFERLEARNRAETLAHDNIAISSDGFRSIHRSMFQNIYDWAGEYRDVNTGRTGPFAKVDYIAPEMEKRFAAINAEDNLRGLTADQFSARAAEHVNELNAIHCFLDGNGRTQREFLQVIGKQAGHELDFSRTTPEAWNTAAKVGYYKQDYEPMREVISRAIETKKGMTMQTESEQEQAAAPFVEQAPASGIGADMENAASVGFEAASDYSTGAINATSDAFESLLGGSPSPSPEVSIPSPEQKPSFEEYKTAQLAEAKQRSADLQSLAEAHGYGNGVEQELISDRSR